MLQDILNVPHQVRDAERDAWAVSVLGQEEHDGEWTGWLAFVSSMEGPARLAGPLVREPSVEALFRWGRQLSQDEVEEAFRQSRQVGMDVVAPRPPDWGPHRPGAPGPPYQP